jgi:hypothetical protein
MEICASPPNHQCDPSTGDISCVDSPLRPCETGVYPRCGDSTTMIFCTGGNENSIPCGDGDVCGELPYVHCE